MTDPKETTNDMQMQQHVGGQPNALEDDADTGSDVGGPAGSVQSGAESAVHHDKSIQDDDQLDEARNPI
jgi:hypothetical protein